MNYLIIGALCGTIFFTGGYFVSESTNDTYWLFYENKNQRAIILEIEQHKTDLQEALDKKIKEYDRLSEILNQVLNGSDEYPMCYDPFILDVK